MLLCPRWSPNWKGAGGGTQRWAPPPPQTRSLGTLLSPSPGLQTQLTLGGPRFLVPHLVSVGECGLGPSGLRGRCLGVPGGAWPCRGPPAGARCLSLPREQRRAARTVRLALASLSELGERQLQPTLTARPGRSRPDRALSLRGQERAAGLRGRGYGVAFRCPSGRAAWPPTRLSTCELPRETKLSVPSRTGLRLGRGGLLGTGINRAAADRPSPVAGSLRGLGWGGGAVV